MSSKIEVAIRVRPFLNNELKAGHNQTRLRYDTETKELL
jgi:hypothetical protein